MRSRFRLCEKFREDLEPPRHRMKPENAIDIHSLKIDVAEGVHVAGNEGRKDDNRNDDEGGAFWASFPYRRPECESRWGPRALEGSFPFHRRRTVPMKRSGTSLTVTTMFANRW